MSVPASAPWINNFGHYGRPLWTTIMDDHYGQFCLYTVFNFGNLIPEALIGLLSMHFIPMSVATCRHQAWHAPNADAVPERKFSAIRGMAMGTHGDTEGQTLGIRYARIAGCQRCNVRKCVHCFPVIARFRIRFESILTPVTRNWDLGSQPAPVPIEILEEEVVSKICHMATKNDSDWRDPSPFRCPAPRQWIDTHWYWLFWSLFVIYNLNISRFDFWGASNLFLPRFAGSVMEDTVEASDGKLVFRNSGDLGDLGDFGSIMINRYQ